MSSSLRNKVPSRHFENLMKSWYKAIYAWYYAHAQSHRIPPQDSLGYTLHR